MTVTSLCSLRQIAVFCSYSIIRYLYQQSFLSIGLNSFYCSMATTGASWESPGNPGPISDPLLPPQGVPEVPGTKHGTRRSSNHGL